MRHKHFQNIFFKIEVKKKLLIYYKTLNNLLIFIFQFFRRYHFEDYVLKYIQITFILSKAIAFV